jgi:hypothetical protein
MPRSVRVAALDTARRNTNAAAAALGRTQKKQEGTTADGQKALRAHAGAAIAATLCVRL